MHFADALAKKDLYAELKVKPTATTAELRSAYRRAALASHPDKGGNAETFHSTVLAFETLSCPTSRALYDQARKQLAPSCANLRKPASGKRRRIPAPCQAGRREPKRPAKCSKRGESPVCGVDHVVAAVPSPPPAPKPRVPEPAPQVDAYLEQLRAILQAMAPSQRCEAITGLTPSVRSALFRFMVSQPTLIDLKTAPSVGRAGGRKRALTSRGTDVRTVRNLHTTTYHAQLRIRHLRLYTRAHADIETAIKHQMFFVQVRHAIENAGDGVWDEPAQFCNTFQDVLNKAGISDVELGLGVFVYMRADEWMDRSMVVTSPVMPLADAVSAHSRLDKARRMSWESLKAEWVPLLRATQHARRGRLSLAQAESAAQGARLRLLERRMARAASHVQRQLGLEERSAARLAEAHARAQLRTTTTTKAAWQRREQRRQREVRAEKLRWLHRPGFTM